MDQLIALGLSLPPIVSSVLSVITLLVLWYGARHLVEQVETKFDPIMSELGEQSKELKSQSSDLVAIKIQTTRTNGKVDALDQQLHAHEGLDEDRHVDAKADLLRNRNSIHDLRDQVSDFAIKVGLQARRINKRDDALGITSKPPPGDEP